MNPHHARPSPPADQSDKEAEALRVVKEALAKYGAGGLGLAFNGGKDCTVVLALLERTLDQSELRQVDIVHFRESGQELFEEALAFIRATEERLGIKVREVEGGVRQGLWSEHRRRPEVKAWLTGRRASDPHAYLEGHFTPCSDGWPPLMRVAPLLNWSYSHVWALLAGPAGVPYCSLYDQGFTSLGSKDASARNPALRRDDGSYQPAWMLQDGTSERHGRE